MVPLIEQHMAMHNIVELCVDKDSLLTSCGDRA